MTLYHIPAAALAELNALATNGVVDITSTAVMNSAFYRAIQSETELEVSGNYNLLRPNTLLLIARIVASSPTIHTIYIDHNGLRVHAPAVAAALAASHTIHSIYMSHNHLYAHGPATAIALAASHTLHTVDMSNNDLGEYGPATATALAASRTIHKVNISENHLGAHGPATASALVLLPTIHSVNMRWNYLREYGPATAAVLADHNQNVADLIELTHLICIEGHSMCDELVDLICSYLNVPIYFNPINLE